MAKKKDRKPQVNGAARQEEEAIRLEVEHVINQDAKYANHLIVQSDAETFQLFFFHVSPPFQLLGADTEEKRREAIKTAGKVSTNCVGRIVVSRQKMGEFVDAMKRNLERSIAKSRDEAEE